MLTRKPHLTTHQPSPTTTSHTVSTAHPLNTLPSKLLDYILLTLRVLLGLSTLLFLSIKSYEDRTIDLLAYPFLSARSSNARPLGYYPSLEDYVCQMPWSHLAPLAFAVLLIVLRRFHTG